MKINMVLKQNRSGKIKMFMSRILGLGRIFKSVLVDAKLVRYQVVIVEFKQHCE